MLQQVVVFEETEEGMEDVVRVMLTAILIPGLVIQMHLTEAKRTDRFGPGGDLKYTVALELEDKVVDALNVMRLNST